MTDDYRGKVFKSGNSMALRLPKALGMTEGMEMRIVRDAQMGFRAAPVDAPKRKVDLSGIWGSCPDLKPLTREDREFDPSPRVWDDPDWPGWRGVAEK